MECPPPNVIEALTPRTANLRDCVTVRSMVNIARLTIWSIYCSRGGGEGRADPSIVAPLRSTIVTLHAYSNGNKSIGVR